MKSGMKSQSTALCSCPPIGCSSAVEYQTMTAAAMHIKFKVDDNEEIPKTS